MRLSLLILFIIAFAFLSNAQPERNNWFFGLNQGITFNGGSPSQLPNSAMRTYMGAASISDSNGVLLFYTNGGLVYSRKHVLMDGSVLSSVLYSTDAISVPSSVEEDQCLVFSTDQSNLRRTTIHAKVDGPYLGEVLGTKDWYAESIMDGITAVKNCAEGGYWLITLNWKQTGLGIWKVDAHDEMEEVYRFHPLPISSGNLIWELMTSNDGSQIVIVGTERILIVDFDSDCGKVKDIHDISAISPFDITNASGACYSPNGEYLYVSFSQGGFPSHGKLMQVLAADPLNKDHWFEVDFPDYGLRGMQNGPDGKMYIITNSIENDRTAIHAVDKPNQRLDIDGVRQKAMELEGPVVTTPFFPNYMNDARVCGVEETPRFEKNHFCLGDSITLKLDRWPLYDSLFLVHQATNRVYDLQNQSTVELGELPVGEHELLVTWSNCAARGEDTLPISVFDKPEVNVEDLELCFGDSAQMQAQGGDSSVLEEWQNQEWIATTKTQLGQAGRYKVTVFEKGCFAEDEFTVSVRDPLLTLLDNDQFVFCEEAENVIVLEAGKGHSSYLWYPTNHTTEWIEVRQSGDYYVVIQDSRGCSGRGDATVISDCTPSVHIPNAFSPNGDGVNDVFELDGRFYKVEQVRIFDRWGECLYATENQPLRWNGTRKGEVLPVGTYYALITYSSEFNDEKVNYKGTVHLIK